MDGESKRDRERKKSDGSTIPSGRLRYPKPHRSSLHRMSQTIRVSMQRTRRVRALLSRMCMGPHPNPPAMLGV